MPRVLIAGFCAVPGPDRAGVQMGHVARALTRDHNVDLLVVRREEQAYVERLATGRILRVPMSEDTLRGRVDAFRRALRRQLEGAEYDVVHFRDSWSGIVVLELREQLGYAAVFDAARAPMSQPQILDLEMSAELSRDEEACLLAADLVLAPTEPARRYIAARGRPARVHMVPPGVDVDRFDWENPPGDGPPVVLYVGTLAPGRGARILLRAMVEVVRRQDARLLLAGPVDREFRETLLDGITNLGLRGKVQLLGEVEHAHIPSLIAQATVCVVPSAVELSPKPTALYPTRILEYMACRRAVVAPRRGTVTMFMRDGVDGLLFTPGDPADLARHIGVLLQDSKLRDQVAQAGYEMVRRNHTASGTRRAVRAAYLALAAMPQWTERLSAEHSASGGVPALPMADITEALEMEDLQEETDQQARAYLPEERDLIGVVDQGDELTRVDLARSEEAGLLEHDRTSKFLDEHATRTLPNARPDSWVVEQTGTTAALLVDDEGTPVDIDAIEAKTPPLETRFVAGELDVPTPRPEAIEGGGDEIFTAVSVLLGSPEGDEDTPVPGE